MEHTKRYNRAASSRAAHNIIIYHAEKAFVCVDGALSTYAEAQMLATPGQSLLEAATFVPMVHGQYDDYHAAVQAALDPQRENVIRYVDCGPSPYCTTEQKEGIFLDNILNNPYVSSVIVRDHHDTAAKVLALYNKKPGASQQFNLQGSHTHVPYIAPRDTEDKLDVYINPRYKSSAMMLFNEFRQYGVYGCVPDIYTVNNKMDGAAVGLRTPEDDAAAMYVDSCNWATLPDAFASIEELLRLSETDMAARGMEDAERHRAEVERILCTPGSTMNFYFTQPDGQVRSALVIDGLKLYSPRQTGRLVQEATKGKHDGVIMTIDTNGSSSARIRSANPDIPATDLADFLKAQVPGATCGGSTHSAVVQFRRKIDDIALLSAPAPTRAISPERAAGMRWRL